MNSFPKPNVISFTEQNQNLNNTCVYMYPCSLEWNWYICPSPFFKCVSTRLTCGAFPPPPICPGESLPCVPAVALSLCQHQHTHSITYLIKHKPHQKFLEIPFFKTSFPTYKIHVQHILYTYLTLLNKNKK